MTEIFKRNTLLDACINNSGNIFDIIRKQRQTIPSVPGMIDGISVDTETHFAKLYGELYDSVKDRDRETVSLKDRRPLQFKRHCQNYSSINKRGSLKTKE